MYPPPRRSGVEFWSKEGTTLQPAPGGDDMVAVTRTLYLLHWIPDGLGEPAGCFWGARGFDSVRRKGG